MEKTRCKGDLNNNESLKTKEWKAMMFYIR